MNSNHYFLIYNKYYNILAHHAKENEKYLSMKSRLDLLCIDNLHSKFMKNVDPYLDMILFVEIIEMTRNFLKNVDKRALISINVNSTLIDSEYEKVHDVIKVMGE